MTATHELTPIGTVHSCFPDKFGVPRQPGLCPSARGSIALNPPWNDPDCFRGLEAFSHIWVTFIFHEVPASREARPWSDRHDSGQHKGLASLPAARPSGPTGWVSHWSASMGCSGMRGTSAWAFPSLTSLRGLRSSTLNPMCRGATAVRMQRAHGRARRLRTS